MKKYFAVLLFLVSFLSLVQTGVHAAPETVIEEGKKVKMNYTLTIDGKEVDSTASRTPLEFVYGEPSLLPSLQKSVAGLKAGGKKKFTLTPAEGFGEVNPKAVVEAPRANFRDEKVETGMTFTTTGPTGAPLQGTVKEVKKDTVLIDFNHPFAGKTVTFDVEILEVI